MDLLCTEKPLDCYDEDPAVLQYEEVSFTRSYPDPVLLDDDRVLERLLQTEDKCVISSSYFKCVQTDIKQSMRATVAGWMLEICEDQNCEEGVFSLAMNYLDRFLSVVEITRCQLQLLGAVCLFLSSKLKDSRPLSAEKLCRFTDNSITLHELTSWELLVLSKLKWDMRAITPHDFLEYILRRLPSYNNDCRVKRHALTFMTICASDFTFSMHSPSIIAAASILSAIKGLIDPSRQREEVNSIISKLHSITHIDTDVIRSCLEQLEQLVNIILVNRQNGSSSMDVGQSDASSTTTSLVSEKLSSRQDLVDTDHPHVETPTDVRDIHF
ncbi:hypothetical protein CHUAL_005658 [Chamberlinius hualienensis]